MPSPTAQRDPVAVSLQRVSKRFMRRRGWRETLAQPGKRAFVTALNDASLEIETGEFFGLLGPNGAGKTTLFKVLATLVLPDSGQVRVSGFDVERDGRAIREILAPVIADERSLFWRLSAKENLELYATLQGLRGDTARARVGELLHVVGLESTGPQLVGAFSSGMKQRLLIARALVARPRVLLLDEPTRSLDPMSARTFREFLRDEISGRQGCTVLLATHNAEEALELCGRVGILDRGRLLAVGTARELSREIGEDRYRLWVRGAFQPHFEKLRSSGLVSDVRRQASEDGWTRIDLSIAGGHAGTARLITRLGDGGVAVARLEQHAPSLADLITEIVRRRGGEGKEVATDGAADA
jgi:ABC-2 type transport system ATP-binding protein